MKKLEDYLKFYIGTECQYVDEDKNEMIAPMLSYNLQGYAKFVDPEFDEWIPAKDIKPILRKLEDMTEEEANQIYDELYPHEAQNPKVIEYWGSKLGWFKELLTADLRYLNVSCLYARDFWDLTRILCKYSFDLFGLIEENLAINKATLG